MDPDVLRAFVAAEDRRFYATPVWTSGRWRRALRRQSRRRPVVSGASTITDAARPPAPRRCRARCPAKCVQALWALRLDAHLSKQAILEQYLNRVPLGQGAIGVEAAAALYFGASARDLCTGQAALLAGVAGAPSRDNPLVSQPRRRGAPAPWS